MSSIDRLLSLTGLKADDIEEPITLSKTNMSYLNTMKKDILDSKKKVSFIYDPHTEELQELESGELPSINSFYKKKYIELFLT